MKLAPQPRETLLSYRLVDLGQKVEGERQVVDLPAEDGYGESHGLDLDNANDFSREQYDRIYENPFYTTISAPLSTFSIDVDTASYANVSRYIEGGSLPPADAVRLEELVNYFDYDYKQPTRWSAVLGRRRGRIGALGPHAPPGAHRPQGARDPAYGSPARRTWSSCSTSRAR